MENFKSLPSGEAGFHYLDSIVSSMIDALIVVDNTENIKAANKAALNLLEYSAVDLLNQPFTTILSEQDLLPMIRGLIEGGSLQEFELTYRSKTGRLIPVSCSTSLIRDETGEIREIVWIAKDITERKQAEEALRESEERYRSLFENVPIGVYRTTPDGRVINANPALLKMLGFESLEELTTGNPEGDGFEPGYSRKEFRQKLEREGEIKALEGVWKKKDGEVVYITENAKVVRDPSGKPLYYEGTVEDITERKNIEQLKNDLVSIVSHELRVPLTSIRGGLEWSLQKIGTEVPEKVRHMLDIASRSSERMVRLLNDILDIDKIESGKMVFHPRPVEIVSLLEQAIEDNQTYAEQFQVGLRLEHQLAGQKVYADADRLLQVMTNLLSNAVKFSPPEATVDIAAKIENARILVTITDHGLGIPEQFQPRIFQKFAHLGMEDRQKGGTGLGLNISKIIIEKMGGVIGFETKFNHGTTFYFELPEYREEMRNSPS